MGRPYGLLRAGFPYLKTVGMRRVTNFPVDLAIGADGFPGVDWRGGRYRRSAVAGRRSGAHP